MTVKRMNNVGIVAKLVGDVVQLHDRLKWFAPTAPN